MLLQLNAKNILQQLLSWRKDPSCFRPRQTKPSLEDLDSPSPSFQGVKILQAALKISFVGGVHLADCTEEQNYPNKPRYETRSLSSRANQAHAPAVSELLRPGWVSLHRAALCRVSTRDTIQFQGRSSPGAVGSSVRERCVGHQKPIAGGNHSAPGAKVHKNVKAPGLESQYP